MGPIQVVVQDGNNLVLEVTPTPDTTVILDRGIIGPPGPMGDGDVDGPASATDNALARFNGTTGKLIQNSVGTLSDAGVLAGLAAVDTTALDATNINAFDGTASFSIANSTGVMSIDDTKFTLQDNADNTKKAIFELSGITTATTRTYTLPNLTGSLATIGTLTQTFSGTTTFSGATVTVGSSTATSTYGLGSGASIATATKTINIGIAGVSGSTTNINYGSAVTGALGTHIWNIGGEQMRLTSTGLGIGTSSPNYRLDVAGTTNAVALGTTLSYGVAGEVYSAFRFGNSTFAGGNSEIRNIVNGATSIGSALAFFTTQTGVGSLTERLRIDNQGNLGLGVTSTNQRLRVVAGDGTQVGFSGATRGVRYDFDATGSFIYGVDNTLFGSYQPLTVGGSVTVLATGGTERARIDASGNLGIGTTSPTSKLDVNGTVTATGWSGGGIVTETATQTLTGTKTFSGTSSTLAIVLNDAAEVTTVSATAATGTIAYDITTQSVLYYTANATANWTVNFRASSGTTLNTALAVGQSVTVAFLVTQGATAFFNNVVQVDGTAVGVTTRWIGGAPTAGNASGIDSYRYLIIKTAASTYTVLASVTQFKA